LRCFFSARFCLRFNCFSVGAYEIREFSDVILKDRSQTFGGGGGGGGGGGSGGGGGDGDPALACLAFFFLAFFEGGGKSDNR
jgi:hypothetical protein